jgi:hypothetical protein
MPDTCNEGECRSMTIALLAVLGVDLIVIVVLVGAVPHPVGYGQCVTRRAAIDDTPELWVATVDPQPAAGGSLPGDNLNASTTGSGPESSEWP